MELRRAPRTGRALPAPLTSLIGRESETSDLTAPVGAHRLVTLTGPAGVGKTRLALRIAAVQAVVFRDGARLADLAPVGPELAGDTLARALGVVPQPGWPLRDILREVAGGMRGLLLVDNCEHVIAEAAEIIADLLTAGGLLRVLATSREPLGIPGEVSYQVPTLPVPTPARFRPPAARRQHVVHYLALAEQAAEQLRTPDQRAWLDRLATEQPNLRAALANSITTGDIESAWRSAAALHRFWDITAPALHEALARSPASRSCS